MILEEIEVTITLVLNNQHLQCGDEEAELVMLQEQRLHTEEEQEVVSKQVLTLLTEEELELATQQQQ